MTAPAPAPAPAPAAAPAVELPSGTRARCVETIADVRSEVARWKANGQRVALVPTMGALHAGHTSLVTLARRHAPRVVVSIFVNPTQFGPREDFAAYPRDLNRDLEACAAAGVDLVFAPGVREMYPEGFQTSIVPGRVAEGLCGASRPGHFAGVATVVTKLFAIVMPEVAVFGEKDWQQLAVIRRVTADLELPVEVVGAPTRREPDGLAMSSRNVYLGAGEERRAAGSLVAGLRAAAAAWRAGERDGTRLVAAARAKLAVEPEYLELRHEADLAPWTEASDGRAPVLLVAARVGRTRLIDNLRLGEPEATP